MPEHQNLIFNKEEMEDYKKLSDYNVKKESNLILVKWIKTIEPDPEYGTFYTVKHNESFLHFNFPLYIRILTGKFIILNMNGKDTIINIKEKIKEKEGIPLDEQMLFFSSLLLEDNRTIASYEINENEYSYCHLVIKQENENKKSFNDLSFQNLLKRDELNVNLIYFDLKMTNKENYQYFNDFKVDVVGGFHAIDDLNILKQYLEKIKDKDIPFIVISSGTSGKDVISICKQYSFIKEVIIFCSNYKYNEHYLKEYPNYVKKVLIDIKQVYEYIKTFVADEYKNGIEKYWNEDKYIFSSNEIKMDKQLQLCPLISSIEYDRCYFLIHKIYSHFFGDMNNKNENSMFKTENLNKILDYLNQLNFEKEDEKDFLSNCFKILLNLENNDNFVERSIRLYTGESNFCYLFNRVMRNFEKGLISLAYYMGPFLYSLNKYVKDNPSFAMSKSMKLYRIIQCSKLDFYQYKLNLGHIICFPSLTSTSSVEIKFKPTELAQKTNKNN